MSAAVSIRAEVKAQADYVISVLEQVELFVKTKLRKICRRHLLCYAGLELEHTTEKMASVSGHFIKWKARKTIKRETSLPESCLNLGMYSLRHD